MTVSQSCLDPLFLGQLAVKIGGVSWRVYEAAMISSQDQNVQCTVEQIVVGPRFAVVRRRTLKDQS